LKTAEAAEHLAGLYDRWGKPNLAEPLHRRALDVFMVRLGPNHADVAGVLFGLANNARTRGAYAEAESLYRRIQDILTLAQGSDSPQLPAVYSGLAAVMTEGGRLAEAGPLFQKALDAMEKRLGPRHPELARTLNLYARFLWESGDPQGAEREYRRAAAIQEDVLGSDHPDLAYRNRATWPGLRACWTGPPGPSNAAKARTAWLWLRRITTWPNSTKG
jgi:tetratricopeptide (TPR) repeat protein